MAFFTFFQKFACSAENFAKIWSLKGSENQFGRLKKEGREKSQIFFKNPPLLKKILETPLKWTKMAV